VQATKDTKWLKSEHRDCWAGGEMIRPLCPTKVFAPLVKGRGGRDRAKNNSFLKNFVRHTLNKNRFFARVRRQDYRR